MPLFTSKLVLSWRFPFLMGPIQTRTEIEARDAILNLKLLRALPALSFYSEIALASPFPCKTLGMRTKPILSE